MRLTEIYIYPIKSLGGIRLEKWTLEERGFKYDRRWMLVDEEGIFLSQRKHPRMALLQVVLLEDGLRVEQKTNSANNVFIPFEAATLGRITVNIWEDNVEADVLGDQFGEWFSDFLGISCRLVRMSDNSERRLKPKYAVNDESVSFADGMPYLIIGQASLDILNEKLEEPVGMDRFRPNLVFEGGIPFAEDDWLKVEIGNALFKITKPCARCVMTTVDQGTAERGKEPLKTLSTFRLVENNVMFGQNMLMLKGHEVKVGDELLPEKK
ncbi:MOSC domain-containing protein [Arthrospiribacter ruber]|uniref:MOSC domain-containing protein n=1 Tax=Arthrospiribacter ruber TaxID=2487934 RepID=A0A951J5W1_9BACT|nr:MOSC N-terminal beta barrel domain-containing protein [Arthrospiribacter ruber]MBW3470387.1 MOSC domain-containing protein [Arthrospiribacter ruber]